MSPEPKIKRLLEVGMKAYAAGRTDDARAAFQEALLLDPESTKARTLVKRLFPGLDVDAEISNRPATPSPWVEDAPAGGADLALDQEKPWGFEPPAGDDPWEDAEVSMTEPAQGGSDPELVWSEEVRDAWGEPVSKDGVDAAALAEGPEGPWDEGAALSAPKAPGLDLLVADQPGAPAAPAPEAPAAAPPEPEPPPEDEGVAEEVHRLMDGARDLFELADFSGSLELVEKALELDPENAEARDYLEKNEGTLLQMYESKLGNLELCPRVVINPDEIVWLNLDHRAGFVLAQIDGTLSWEDVFALSGMSRLDTCRILAQLVEEKVIAAD